ncbi:MAG: hypothetical protein JXR36_04110 [Bacteroidales bacterium]|nr:hypothetical protein [Bacteroidales bacterium]
MVYKMIGQVDYVSEPFSYNKNGDKKIIISLNGVNSKIKNRVEFIPFDFIGKLMDEAEGIKTGMFLEIDFEHRGRKWVEGDITRFYLNLEVISFKVVEYA